MKRAIALAERIYCLNTAKINSFEKDFFKLMNNSVFGKIVENLGKRVDVKLVTDEKQVLKLASKPIFVSSKIFNKNLIAVHKETLFLNRLAYVVVCILNLSETLKCMIFNIITSRNMAAKRDCFDRYRFVML